MSSTFPSNLYLFLAITGNMWVMGLVISDGWSKKLACGIAAFMCFLMMFLMIRTDIKRNP